MVDELPDRGRKGRGAVSNHSGRYERHARVAVDDGWQVADGGFKRFHTARRTIAGYEIMAMLRKGQVSTISATDMPAQAAFIATLFGIAA